MATDALGLYVHIPFCASKCRYCDFASFSNVSREVRERYISRLCEEIESYARSNKIKVDTVFFGGGTPSLLDEGELERITCSINKAFALDPNAEFTLEANPKTVTLEKLKHFASCGVNRISFGAQSFCENELKILGRIHTSADANATARMVREAGIDNLSIDLMYGIPEQTKESFLESLKAALALSPNHVSAYGLIIEEGTPFYKLRDTLQLPSENEECDMYSLAAELLAQNGFSHYEISNYAKEGFECRHNLKYWRDEEFIGVGLSAYSYYGNKRYGNSSNIGEYLTDNYIDYRYVEHISVPDNAFEYVMMRLRLKEGFSLSDYKSRFGRDFSRSREDKLARFAELGYLLRSEDRIALTESGFYVSNAILSELL